MDISISKENAITFRYSRLMGESHHHHIDDGLLALRTDHQTDIRHTVDVPDTRADRPRTSCDHLLFATYLHSPYLQSLATDEAAGKGVGEILAQVSTTDRCGMDPSPRLIFTSATMTRKTWEEGPRTQVPPLFFCPDFCTHLIGVVGRAKHFPH